MNLKVTQRRLLAAAIVVLSVWSVHGFIGALLATWVWPDS